MPGRRITKRERTRILKLRGQGYTQKEIANITGRSTRAIWTTLHGVEKDWSGQRRTIPDMERPDENPPKTWDQLDDLGKRCLESFELFATTFFCLRTPAWWTIAAEQLVEDVTTDEETFTLLHAPTGSGKTTLLEVLILWLMSGGGSCDPEQGRAMRFLFGSATLPKAIRSVDRLRRIIEDPHPFHDVRAKRTAERSLVQVFGRYKPDPAENDDVAMWQQSQFTVASVGEHALAQRDPTVSAYSLGAQNMRGSSPLSVRADVVIADDPALMETLGSETLLESFEANFESRLEPGGSLFAVGQRLAATDLYGSLAARTWTDDQGVEEPVYTVVSFPAHRDHHEGDEHNGSGEPSEHSEWDGRNGCLLDAVRLPYRKLQREMVKASFPAMFQQDVESSSALGLVERAWIDGTMDSTGFVGPGCWDDDRGFYDFVSDENGHPLPAYISIDPSGGEGFWSLELWQVDRATRRRYLIAGDRGKYNVRDILDGVNGEFTGVIPDMTMTAALAGARVSVVVMESNSASHFLQSSTWDLWRRIWSDVLIVPFVTRANRNDPVIGVSALLQPAYRNGEVRLPRRGEWKNYLKPKLDELTLARPRTTDTIMAEWVGAASVDKVLQHTRRHRGPSPVVRHRGQLLQANYKDDHSNVMQVYGQPVSRDTMPFEPFEPNMLPVDQRPKVSFGPGPSNPVARIALGLPTSRSPNEKTNRPDGVNP